MPSDPEFNMLFARLASGHAAVRGWRQTYGWQPVR